MKRIRTSYDGYVVALLAVLVAVLIRQFVLDKILGQQFPFVLFLMAVVAAAWFGGAKSGVFAVAFGAVASYFYFDDGRLAAPLELDEVRLVLFIVFGGLASYWIGRFDSQRTQIATETQIRQQAELALREREERIRMAVESADIGTWDLNVLTGERQWSDRSKAMFGLPLDADVSQLSFVDLLHPEDRLRTGLAIQAALDPRGDGHYEIDYRTAWADGTVRWVIAKGQAFFQGEGPDRQAHRFIGTVLDITERKEIEQALRHADQRKNDFLATVAHELRNPLTPISNALQIWPAIEGNPIRMEQLRAVMDRNVQQMIRLIDDLMDVERISTGKIDLRIEKLNLGTVILAAVESVQPLIRNGEHQLTVTLPEESVFLEGDAVRLVQVFGNILTNAAKFTGRHGIISVMAEKHGNQAIVKIKDNGLGIPTNMLAEIFESYRQVHETREQSRGGLGIGLSLAKRLVGMHAGTIEARSEGLDKGSEFVVILPTPAYDDNHHTGEGLSTRQHVSAIPRHRILVVDDLPEVAESFATLLDVAGQDVLTAHDGRSAIASVLADRPEVVFLDIAMPGMDGYAVARHLRAQPELKVMLVALTGYGQGEDYRQAMEAGFDHHLTKPTSLEKVRELLLSVPVESKP